METTTSLTETATSLLETPTSLTETATSLLETPTSLTETATSLLETPESGTETATPIGTGTSTGTLPRLPNTGSGSAQADGIPSGSLVFLSIVLLVLGTAVAFVRKQRWNEQ